MWRKVPGHDGYEVSDGGQVRSIDRTVPSSRWPSGRRFIPGRVLRQIETGGYVYVSGGKSVKIKVHQAVASAFLGPRPPGMVIRHLNGDHKDNRVSNLQYGTQSENMQDAVRHGSLDQLRRTRCPQGHPYDSENTEVTRTASGGTGRACRQCRRDRYERNREAINARRRERYARRAA